MTAVVDRGAAAGPRPKRRLPGWARSMIVVAIGIVILVAVLSRRIESFWQHLKQGVAIFREPRRYVRRVLAWQEAGWVLRFASFWRSSEGIS